MKRLFLIAVLFLCGGADAATTGTWRIAGVMLDERAGHTATLLEDGTVLIAGGARGEVMVAAAEIFDPRTGAFTPAGVMAAPRRGHAAVRLADGRVLIAGGWRELDNVFTYEVKTSEIFDPATRSFTAAGQTRGRFEPSLIALPDGGALLFGGLCEGRVERFDPASLTFESDGWLAHHLETASAVTASGRVVVTGGAACGPGGEYSSTEVTRLEPHGGVDPFGSLRLSRRRHSATALEGESILVAGGSGRDLDPQVPRGMRDSAELLDGATGESVLVGSMRVARASHSAVRLPTGEVLLAGGVRDDSTAIRSTEIFDPVRRLFVETGALQLARAGAPIVLTQEGRVFIFGGDADATVEEFVPSVMRRRAVRSR